MNTKEEKEFAKQLREQAIALNAIADKIEKSSIDANTPSKEAESFTPELITPQPHEDDD